MNILFIVLSTVLLLHQTLAEETKIGNLSCEELNGILLGSLLFGLSKPQNDVPINFKLAEKNNENGTAIGNGDFTTLQSKKFDPSLKTYIISHGYMSHYKKPWVTTLKNQLLDSVCIVYISIIFFRTTYLILRLPTNSRKKVTSS